MIQTLVTAAAAALAQSAMAPPPLQQLFVSACFEGSVQLTGYNAQAVDFGALPETLREPLGSPAQSRVWKLNSAGDTYLYVLQYSEPKGAVQVCGLASNRLSIADGRRAIAARLGVAPDDSSDDGNSASTEWYVAAARSHALATRVGGYTTLQVNQLPGGQTE